MLGRFIEILLDFSKVILFFNYKRVAIDDLFANDLIYEKSNSSSNKEDLLDCELTSLLFKTLEGLFFLLKYMGESASTLIKW